MTVHRSTLSRWHHIFCASGPSKAGVRCTRPRRPDPEKWSDASLTAAWLGHATVLINFFGFNIITDPVLFPRIGIRFPGLTIGPKRLIAPALEVTELPRIDLVLLSHAHFDHFDLPHSASPSAKCGGDYSAANE